MRIRGVTRNVVVLGWVSFFTDLASEMLYPVMPLFLVGTLGVALWMKCQIPTTQVFHSGTWRSFVSRPLLSG